jgi:hypothetical protein
MVTFGRIDILPMYTRIFEPCQMSGITKNQGHGGGGVKELDLSPFRCTLFKKLTGRDLPKKEASSPYNSRLCIKEGKQNCPLFDLTTSTEGGEGGLFLHVDHHANSVPAILFCLFLVVVGIEWDPSI